MPVYNSYMNVWRVISLTLWTIVLTTLLIASSTYYLLSYTVLDQSKATAALRQTKFYDVVRDEALLPKVQDHIASEQDAGAVLPAKDVLAGVNQVFTTDKVRAITDQVLAATYKWTDNKAPSIEFSIPITSEKEALAKELEARINRNVDGLPRCGANDVISESPAEMTCLPLYVSRDAVSAEAVSDMQNRLQSVEDTLTPEALHVTNRDLGSAVNTPDYIGYIWTLNLITLPLAIIVSLYLLLKRRGAGLVAIGVSIFLAGIIGLSSYGVLHSPSLAATDNALDNEIIKASQLLIQPTLLLGSGIGVAVGIVAIAGGILWARRAKRA